MPVVSRVVIAIVAIAALGSVQRAAALTCGIERDAAEQAIVAGWPEADPYEYVFIATVLHVVPEQGGAGSSGEVLTIRIDAVLRGDLPLTTDRVFNPPLGSSGWLGFERGHEYLIAARPNWNDDDGRVSTFLCTPNEEITSRERFAELVALAADPRLPDTALERGSVVRGIGMTVLAGAAVLAIAQLRTMRRRGLLHR